VRIIEFVEFGLRIGDSCPRIVAEGRESMAIEQTRPHHATLSQANSCQHFPNHDVHVPNLIRASEKRGRIFTHCAIWIEQLSSDRLLGAN
jgi:hypothetical protein